MLGFLRKLQYGARVFLASRYGEPQTIDVAGYPTQVMHGGKGEPFVYLHSTLGESIRWLPFHQAFANKYEVLAPTHPGFNDSPAHEGIDTIEDLAFHYVQMFDALGWDQVILGGVSLGGWIAAEFAVRWPERIKKLWIADAPGLNVPETPLPDLFRVMQHREAMRRLLFHDPDGPMASLLMGSEPDEATLIRGYRNLAGLAKLMWKRPYDPKLASRLRRVTCPTLLLWGADDKLVPPAYGEAYRKHLPHAEWKTIPGSGHLPMFEKEREFVDAIMQFATRPG
ncbi:MAG: alpha/beta hydrolase [Gemmataceae bacterium]|nr:alpha/beta hydrolase [Gemmataceae bacterium]